MILYQCGVLAPPQVVCEFLKMDFEWKNDWTFKKFYSFDEEINRAEKIHSTTARGIVSGVGSG